MPIKVGGSKGAKTRKKNDEQLKRVVIYSRVSTDHFEQESSLENQKQLGDDVERSGKAKLVGIYEDKGISGTSTKGRAEFLQMMKDAEAGKFDWIICKNISRFARNLADMVVRTRELMGYGVYVYFQEENMRTDDKNAEFTLHILSCVAEQESRNTSSHIKEVIRAKHKQGLIATKSKAPLGYDFVKVDDKEHGGKKWSYKKNEDAPIVFDMFNWCIDGNGEKKISQLVFEKYGREIPARSIHYILTNVVYKGSLLLGKTYHDKKTGRRVFNTVDAETGEYEEEAWLEENNHLDEAIVSSAVFDLAQEAIQIRKEKNGKYAPNSNSNEWTHKFKCGHCGNYLNSYHSEYLTCSHNNNFGVRWQGDLCENIRMIRVDALKNVLKDICAYTNLALKVDPKQFTDQQKQYLKTIEKIELSDVVDGVFRVDEENEIQELTVNVLNDLTFKLTTPVRDANFKDLHIEIITSPSTEKERVE